MADIGVEYMALPELVSWDLGADDHLRDEMIGANREVAVILHLYIRLKRTAPPDMFSIQIVSPNFVSLPGWNYIHKSIVTNQGFVPAQLAESIGRILATTNFATPEHALEQLRSIFNWEFEHNAGRDFADALQRAADAV
ncbi:MAG: Imm8 family immunity protein [Pseudomonadota bacterium]